MSPLLMGSPSFGGWLVVGDWWSVEDNKRMLFFHQPLTTNYQPPRNLDGALLFQLHVERQPADFVGEHVEAGGGARFQPVLALDHRFVNLGPAFHLFPFY